MKTLTEFLTEASIKIDDTWLDNEKPVKTEDGRNAIVLDIDISKVPNIIKGQVNTDGKMCEYEWNDDGECIKATDTFGNPKNPSNGDRLVKAI